MSKLLIDDHPIQVLPKLAMEIGLNEAIFLQQLHYWLKPNRSKLIDGRLWVYNTYEGWQENFPFWSTATIRRTINSCEKKKLIVTANYNRAKFDKTKWYSIDYEEVERINSRVAQNEQTGCSNRADGTGQNEPMEQVKMSSPIPLDYTETIFHETILKDTSAELKDEKEKIYLTSKASESCSSKVNDNQTSDYIPVNEIDDSILDCYNEVYKLKFGKEHPAIHKDRVRDVIDSLNDDWITELDEPKTVIEFYFKNLPVSNDGKVYGFIHEGVRRRIEEDFYFNVSEGSF